MERSLDRSPFGSRLFAARRKAELTQAQLAKAVGISQSALASAERMGAGSSYTPQIAKITGVNSHWLATGDGPMTDVEDSTSDTIPYNLSKVREVFVVGRGSGGAMPERVWTDGDYPTGATDAFAEIATNDPHAFLTEVQGPSMIPRYNPGEFALVEPGTEPELEDDVLVRLASGSTMIKRLLSQRHSWRFGSYNSPEVLHYEPGDVTWVYYIAHPVPRRKIKNRC